MLAACVAAALVVGLGAGGCGRRVKPMADDAEHAGRAAQAIEPGDASRGPRGLEVQVWVVDDLGGQVARALGDLEEPARALDAGDARRWRDSGLRVVGVDAGRVDAIRGQLQLAAPVRREWVGQVLAWRPVAQGPALRNERVSAATGPVWIESGSLRLMARAWTRPRVRPGEAAAAETRLELVPQVVVPRAAQTLAQIESRLRGELPTPGEDGPVLEQLAIALSLADGEALIIVGESPGTDWRDEARMAEVTLETSGAGVTGPPVPGDDDAGAAYRGGAAPGRVADPWEAVADPIGPGAPEARTLGESMLSGRLATRIDEVGDGRVLRPRRRALIVLIPHGSGAYTIVPAPVGAPG